MCGGYGTRIWPMSRQSFPKQFQPLLEDGSFFKKTLSRVKIGFSSKDIFFSTSQDQVKFVKAQAKDVPPRNIIAEPERRDNLGAVAYATAYIDHFYPGSLMAIIWGADHVVQQEKKFIRALLAAARVCQQKNVIVKIDTKTDYVSASWGWIKTGKKVGEVAGFSIYELLKFIEKPGIEKAKKFHALKNYCVHVGYSVWRTATFLKLLELYAPDCYRHIAKIQKAIGTKKERPVLKKEYHLIEKTSIDFGLYEKLPSRHLLEIPTDMGWRDSGTWQQLYEAVAIGQKQNIFKGEVEFIGSKGNLVYVPKGKATAVIGVDNLVVVDTKDGLLVCRREKADQVKKFLDILKAKGKEEYL